MVACAAICAPDDEEARYLAGPSRLSFARLRQGRPGRFPTPEEAAEPQVLGPGGVRGQDGLGSAVIGGPEKVRDRARSSSPSARAPRS